MEDNKKKFIKRLQKLTKETGIAIGGCGCCGSPFLYEIDIEDGAGYISKSNNDEEIEWITPSEDFYWKEHKDKL